MNRMLRRTRLIGFVTLGLISIGLWQFALAPRFAEPSAIQTQVDDQLTSAALIDDETAVLTTRERLLTTAAGEADKLSVQLPEVAAAPELASQLNALAVSAGMTPDQITTLTTSALSLAPAATTAAPAAAAAAPAAGAAPAPAPDPAAAAAAAKNLAVYQMAISLSAKGTFAQLVAFLNTLYTSPRILTIDSAVIGPSSTAAMAGGIFQVTISARTFVAKGMGKAPAPVNINTGVVVSGESSAGPNQADTPTATPTTSATPSK